MKALCLILLLITARFSTAQEVPVITQQQLENLEEEITEDDALLQQMEYYRRHPINLNTVTPEELSALRFITDWQVANFMRYRSLFGKLVDIYELQAIPGFDLLTIQKILPYVYAGDAVSVKERLPARFTNGVRYALFRISRVLERAKGYDTSRSTHYLGDRNHLLARYQYQYKNLLYYGVVADKDAGEPFFRNTSKTGFDFYSLHFFTRQLGKVKALALGDYVVNVGQGLIHWQSLAFGKNAEVLPVKRQSPVLQPYRSAGEFYFNRGAAATVQIKSWEATAFVSSKKFSGNIVRDSLERITSFSTTGLHRTKSEMADRNTISDLSLGGNLSYQNHYFKAGVNAVLHRFSLPLQRRPEPYNYFAPSGKDAFHVSMDYSFTHKNAHFFGELAVDKNLHRAFIQGVMMSADQKVDLVLLYRNIAKEYQALFGRAFMESSLPSNEAGLYSGVVIRPAVGWRLAAYTDFYQFHFMKYRVSAPVRGWDYLAQLTYAPNKRTEIYLRYRAENKPQDASGETRMLDVPVDKRRRNLRLHYVTQLSSSFSFRSRTEINWLVKENEQNEEGFLSYVEAAYQHSEKWKVHVRVQYFETAGYDSRIYAYENDVLYSFSIPAFFDKGFRYYLNVHFDMNNRFSFWTRVAMTLYKGREKIGSGLDEITGNHKSEVRFQMRYRLE